VSKQILPLANCTSQRRYIEANTVLFVSAATSCLLKPSPSAKEFPKHLRGTALPLEDPSNRKPSRRDPFCDGPDQSKPYVWEEFTSATPAFNKDRKAIDLSKERRLWYYLGKSSTESKAHYTGDLTKPVNDPASNFLQSVEPAKRPLIPQPQPVRRQSLPASYPGQHPTGLNIPPAHAAMATPRRLSQAGQSEQRTVEDYQRRMAILGSPAAPISPTQYYSGYPAGGNRSPGIVYQDQRNRLSQLPTEAAIREAMLAKQKSILERSQQRAMVLDQQDRPYAYKPKSSMPPPNIGIDTQSVERQRDFQRRAYQQSLANTQLSPHSPGMHSGFITNGQIPQLQQLAGPDRATSHVPLQRSPNTAQYGQASPSPTEAAFPLLRRPQQSPNSSAPDFQQDSFQLHSQPISSQQQSHSVNSFNNQRRFSQPTYPHPQLFSHQSPLPLSPPQTFSMSSPGNTAPIDIPQPRQTSAGRVRNQGQHTANFIDPNLMQLNPNHQTMTAANMSFTNNGNSKADQATRAMPPPPVPSQSPYPTVTSSATDLGPDYAQTSHNYGAYNPQLAKDSGKKAVRFSFSPNPDLTAALNDALTNSLPKTDYNTDGHRTLINDKKTPQSIVNMRQNSNIHHSRPKVYATPYEVGFAAGRFISSFTTSNTSTSPVKDEGMTLYGNGLSSKPVGDGDEANGCEWVGIEQLDAEEEAAEVEKQYVQVDHPGLGGRNRGLAGRRRTSAAAAATPAEELAKQFYARKNDEEKKKIDVVAEKDGTRRFTTK
jgi:hypothetical protein